MMMLQGNRRWGVGLVLLGLGACGSESTDPAEVTGRAVESARGDGVVRGKVTRKIDLSDDGDGIGALHISLAEECLAKDGTAPKLVAKIDVEKANLVADDASVAFEITDVADGTYQAATWFDDVANPDQDEDLPGKGDLAMFRAATPICVPVVIKDGGLVDGVTLALNYVMPFDLTGAMADDRGGVLDDMDGAGADPSDIDTDDPNTYEVKFEVTRTAELDAKGDGIGDAVFTLSETCFDPSGDPPPPQYAIEQKDVDLSDKGASATLTFEGVKNGIYQLNGYIDDVGTRTDERPLPSSGDLVRFGGFGPGCVEVVVNGGDVETEFDLNFLMTWDLNG